MASSEKLNRKEIQQALFASNKRLEALVTAIAIEQKWQQLHYTEKNIDEQIESVLRQAVYGVDEYNSFSGHARTIFGVDISSNGEQIVKND